MKYIKLTAALLILLILITGGLKKAHPYTETEFLMDTVMTVTAYGHSAKPAVRAAFGRLHELDQLLDAHDPNSQLSQINEAPAYVPIAVDADLFVLLQTALSFSRQSNDAFDCTLLPVTTLWGFGTENTSVPDAAALQAALNLTGVDKLVLDEVTSTVTKLTDGLQLDLGGVAKGFAADEVLRVLQSFGIQSAYLDLGGNVAVMGGKPLSLWESILQRRKTRPFTIGLQMPDASRGDVIETLTLSDGFIVTSGDYERYFELDGIRYHHILDPKTGMPARTGLRSVTVIAQNGAQADMLSTALFVLGKDNIGQLSQLCDGILTIDENLQVEYLQ